MEPDPWLSVVYGTQMSAPSESTIQTFDDAFQPFVKMSDSDDYLKRLENKLARLKGCQQKVTAQGLITMLAMGRNDHMTRWMQENANCQPNSAIADSLIQTNNTAIQMSNVVRRILDPTRQALAEEELQCLVNSDHLQSLYCTQHNIPSVD